MKKKSEKKKEKRNKRRQRKMIKRGTIKIDRCLDEKKRKGIEDI